jgi:phenylacetate-coenzyme A ligase PaaK-like adenylate-forming protein
MLITYLDNLFKTPKNNFEQLALQAFHYQYQYCKIYQLYVNAIGVNPENVTTILEIPFLPISFFKTHSVIDMPNKNAIVFKSSGTTTNTTAKHFVNDIGIYEHSFRQGFADAYGDVSKICILGLLPSYVENGDSSLVYMVDDLIKQSSYADSGIYLYDTKKLQSILLKNAAENIPTILIGVTYALLQFAQEFPMLLQSNIIMMETGGMKGRGKEMTRMEVHQNLQNAFGLSTIHSEYGMTELLSQAYSKGNGIFSCSQSMKVLCRDFNDPLTTNLAGKGALNIIDLANIHSCSFIATQDVGEVFDDSSFAVNGRMDESDVRGCNMLV